MKGNRPLDYEVRRPRRGRRRRPNLLWPFFLAAVLLIAVIPVIDVLGSLLYLLLGRFV